MQCNAILFDVGAGQYLEDPALMLGPRATPKKI